MIVAVDTNCIIPGQVGGIESYTLGLVETLIGLPSSITRIILATRPENHELFSRYAGPRCQVICTERPTYAGKAVANWADLAKQDRPAHDRMLRQYQQAKVSMLHQMGVQVVHFPGSSINPIDIDLPVVLNLHDLQHRHYPEYFTADEISLREKWWNAAAYRADAIIAGSQYIADDLHHQLDVPRQKLHVATEIMQQSYFEVPTSAFLADLRNRYRLPERFLIYPAAVWPHKNHCRLIEAFVCQKHATPNDLAGVELLLTGGGQADSALPGLIAADHAKSFIRLLGRVPTEDLRGLYTLATGMLFPSQYEAWSLPIMEAMACGCPVASSNVTSLPEEVADAGLLFDPVRIDDIALSIHRLCTDEKLRQRMSRRGRQRVKDFTPGRYLEVILSAYVSAQARFAARKAA